MKTLYDENSQLKNTIEEKNKEIETLNKTIFDLKRKLEKNEKENRSSQSLNTYTKKRDGVSYLMFYKVLEASRNFWKVLENSRRI